jgi:hypothetical protein
MNALSHKVKLTRQHIVLSRVIMDLLEDINTPRSLALAISYRHSYFKSVDVLLLRDPDLFDTTRYRLDSQAVAFFKKSTYLETGTDLEREAVTNFKKIEVELRAYNDCRKESFLAAGTIYTASRIIRSLLGPLPEYEDLKVSFTKGATFSLIADNATIAAKLSGRLDVTPLAKPHLLKWLGQNETLFRAYQDKEIIEVRGSKFSTVPKDFRKSRTICKEPLGNMLLQRGFGLYIKDKLKRAHIYIETGQSDHQSLLEFDPDCWATIDQSDASDRISVSSQEAASS